MRIQSELALLPMAPHESFDSDELERLEELAEEPEGKLGFVPELVKRAAVAGLGAQRQREVIDVNAAALTHLTALLLPGMLERRRGGILNVASTAAFQPGPNSAVYYATKAYVLSFTEALAEEVRGSGVRVSCLAPGPTDTGFAAQAGATGSRLFQRGVMDAGRVARAGHDGMRRGRTLIIPGLRNRALAFSVRLTPRTLTTRVAARLLA